MQLCSQCVAILSLPRGATCWLRVENPTSAVHQRGDNQQVAVTSLRRGVLTASVVLSDGGRPTSLQWTSNWRPAPAKSSERRGSWGGPL